MLATAVGIMVATDPRLVPQPADAGDRSGPASPVGSDMPKASSRRRARGGSDRLSVLLFSVAAFLVVFALLVSQLPAAGSAVSRPAPVLRKIIRTTIIERDDQGRYRAERNVGLAVGFGVILGAKRGGSHHPDLVEAIR